MTIILWQQEFFGVCVDEINDSATENNGNKIIDGKKMVEWW